VPSYPGYLCASRIEPEHGRGCRAAARVHDRKLLKLALDTGRRSEVYEQPTKTTLQLETLVKQEAAKAISLPKNLVVSIWPMGTAGKSCATARIR